MANENMKNETVNNENIEETKEQVTNQEAPADEQTTEKVGILKKVGGGIKKNWKKVLIPVGVAAAFAGGMAAEKFGFPKFGKGSDADATDADQQ